MLDTSIIKVKSIDETSDYAKFEIEPLEKGYGQTIGNSLRRILLSSLKGAAITSVKINGVKHEYSTIQGVEEDVLALLLKIKQIKLRSFSDEKQTMYLNVKKAGTVMASDIETTSNVEILNPDLVIANLADAKSSLSMELTVETGIGYIAAEKGREEVGVIPLDANFSPIERVNFEVESARLGQVTDLDKLVLEVYTKSISPSQALFDSLEILSNMANAIKAQVVVEAPEEKSVKTKKSKK